MNDRLEMQIHCRPIYGTEQIKAQTGFSQNYQLGS
jgi:hypothetical protein